VASEAAKAAPALPPCRKRGAHAGSMDGAPLGGGGVPTRHLHRPGRSSCTRGGCGRGRGSHESRQAQPAAEDARSQRHVRRRCRRRRRARERLFRLGATPFAKRRRDLCATNGAASAGRETSGFYLEGRAAQRLERGSQSSAQCAAHTLDPARPSRFRQHLTARGLY